MIATEAPPLVLYPYVRGVSPRAILGALWELMEREGATAKVFHAQQGPAMERGDLVEFVRYFDDPKRSLVMAVDGTTVVGMVWFDDHVAGHRLAANVFFARRVWGERARQASREACQWAFTSFGVPAIWAYTPWRTAVRHAQAVGFSIVTTLPGFAYIDGAPQDVTILRLLKEESHG